ncbi:hypothetical protein KIN20_004818 [Parelaphostrongylus tenuis]|uniref:Uncharacterized protein n=1 Tax=Parelaphostrongylus tenuis TaxID=148309 RepID=A0AAD5LZE6_PARTN|nr:hypothetical protein KIN20_004818 [Parelaphostrongylus tenuis]
MNLNMMLVIQRSQSLWILSAYRLIFFGTASDAVNCGVQITAVALTLKTAGIHPLLNSVSLYGLLDQLVNSVHTLESGVSA